MKRDFLKAITSLTYRKFSSNDIGVYLSLQANDITTLEMDYLTPMTDIMKSIIMFIIYGIALFIFIDWRIAFVIFIFSLVTVFLARMVAKPLALKRKTYLAQMGEYVSFSKGFLEGFKLINSQTKASILNEHEDILQLTAQKRYSFGKYKSFNFFADGFLKYLVHIAAFIMIGYLLTRSEISIGTAVATFGYIECFISPIESIMRDISAIHSVKDIKAKVIAHLEDHNTSDLKKLSTFRRSIDLDSLNITQGGFALHDISYHFEKGKKYAIIGQNGSGKSTLLNMMMKYLQPDSGKIMIDDTNIDDVDISSEICCINQNDYIFSTNFMKNVTMFSSYSDKDLPFYKSFVNETISSKIEARDNCQLLSGGEKQIVAMLRMLLTKASVCLMDEPFSAMDERTSQAVQDEILKMKDKTIIMVTHKLSDHLQNFDEILLMQNGRIVKSGKYSIISSSLEYKEFLSPNSSKFEKEVLRA